LQVWNQQSCELLEPALPAVAEGIADDAALGADVRPSGARHVSGGSVRCSDENAPKVRKVL
jgi:hypothetical protein